MFPAVIQRDRSFIWHPGEAGDERGLGRHSTSLSLLVRGPRRISMPVQNAYVLEDQRRPYPRTPCLLLDVVDEMRDSLAWIWFRFCERISLLATG